MRGEAARESLKVARIATLASSVGLATLTGCLEPNEPPQILVPEPTVATLGEPWSIRLLAVDPEDDDLVFGFEAAAPIMAGLDVRALPDGRSFQLTWTPQEQSLGRQQITVWVSDGEHRTGELVFVEVQAGAGQAPIFRKPVSSGISVDLREQPCVEVELQVEDRDSQWLTLAELTQPRGAVLSPHSSGHAGVWTWCPDPSVLSSSVLQLVFIADDDMNDPVEKPFAVSLHGLDAPADQPAP